MQHHHVVGGGVDEGLGHLVRGEHEQALVGLGLLAHARPHVGVEDVGLRSGIDRIARHVDRATGLRCDLRCPLHHLGDGLEPHGGRNAHPHA
jgi:hypothetical protein